MQPLFFFYSSADHRILHSFPTRRSSDLSASRPTPTRRPDAAKRSVSSSSARRDRKSTRLNSSHSQISYAVFCLKKQKTALERLLVAIGERIRCRDVSQPSKSILAKVSTI